MLKGLNRYDIFIIVVIATMVMGTLNFWIFFQHVIAAMLSIPVIAKKMAEWQRGMKVDYVTSYIFILLLWACVSLMWTIDADGGYGSLFVLTCNLLIFLGLYFASDYASRPCTSICYGWMLLLCFSFPVAFWEISTGSHIPYFGDYNDGSMLVGADGVSQDRAFAAVTFRNLNTYGTVLCSALPFVLSACFLMREKFIPLCIALTTIVILIINSSRASMMCIAVDLFFFLVYFRKERFRGRIFFWFVMSVLVVVGLYEFSSVLFNQIAGRLDSVSFGDASRWAVIEYGLKSIAASYGVGWGVGSMQEAYLIVGYTIMLFSHNFVIEFMLEYGVFMCLSFLLLYVRALYLLYRTKLNVLRFLSFALLLSFVPWAIINDSYLEFNFIWAMFASLFVFCRYRGQFGVCKYEM